MGPPAEAAPLCSSIEEWLRRRLETQSLGKSPKHFHVNPSELSIRQRLAKINKQQKRKAQKAASQKARQQVTKAQQQAQQDEEPPFVPPVAKRSYPIEDSELAELGEAGPEPEMGERFCLPVAGLEPADFPRLLMVHRHITTMRKPLELDKGEVPSLEEICLAVSHRGLRSGGMLDRVCLKLLKILLDATEVVVCGADLAALQPEMALFPALFHTYLIHTEERGEDVKQCKEALQRTSDHATFQTCQDHVKILALLCNLVLDCRVIRDFIEEEMEAANSIRLQRHSDRIHRKRKQRAVDDEIKAEHEAKRVANDNEPQWRHEGHPWLGNRVRRDHGQKGINSGYIMKWVDTGADPEVAPALWHVKHENGDAEDLKKDEVVEALALQKSFLDDENGGHTKHLQERLATVRWEPLGRDRHHSQYWLLDSACVSGAGKGSQGAVLVEQSPDVARTNPAADEEEWSTDGDATVDEAAGPAAQRKAAAASPPPFEAPEVGSTVWRFYRKAGKVSALSEGLNSKGEREKALKAGIESRKGEIGESLAKEGKSRFFTKHATPAGAGSPPSAGREEPLAAFRSLIKEAVPSQRLRWKKTTEQDFDKALEEATVWEGLRPAMVMLMQAIRSNELEEWWLGERAVWLDMLQEAQCASQLALALTLLKRALRPTMAGATSAVPVASPKPRAKQVSKPGFDLVEIDSDAEEKPGVGEMDEHGIDWRFRGRWVKRKVMRDYGANGTNVGTVQKYAPAGEDGEEDPALWHIKFEDGDEEDLEEEEVRDAINLYEMVAREQGFAPTNNTKFDKKRVTKKRKVATATGGDTTESEGGGE